MKLREKLNSAYPNGRDQHRPDLVGRRRSHDCHEEIHALEQQDPIKKGNIDRGTSFADC
jgi:hypothetical protein